MREFSLLLESSVTHLIRTITEYTSAFYLSFLYGCNEPEAKGVTCDERPVKRFTPRHFLSIRLLVGTYPREKKEKEARERLLGHGLHSPFQSQRRWEQREASQSKTKMRKQDWLVGIGAARPLHYIHHSNNEKWKAEWTKRQDECMTVGLKEAQSLGEVAQCSIRCGGALMGMSNLRLPTKNLFLFDLWSNSFFSSVIRELAQSVTEDGGQKRPTKIRVHQGLTSSDCSTIAKNTFQKIIKWARMPERTEIALGIMISCCFNPHKICSLPASFSHTKGSLTLPAHI